MARGNWLLAVLSCADDEPLTPVQIQKSLFLLARNQAEAVGEEFYSFTPYDYGPFCVDIYSDIDEFVAMGFLVSRKSKKGNWREYSIADEGKARVAEFKDELSQAALEYLGRVVRWTTSLSFSQLVQKIYEAYPEYRVNSVFQG